MKRLYYLSNNIDVVERLSDQLHQKGISDWNFHVMGKDKANMIRHHVHTTTPLHELDIVRSGERGVLGGFLVGLLVTCYIALFTSFGASMGIIAQAASVILFALFGAWLGGLIGVSTENYKIRRFHKAIDAGNYLIMVDVNHDQRRAVEDVIDKFHDIQRAGEDSTFISPFDKPTVS